MESHHGLQSVELRFLLLRGSLLVLLTGNIEKLVFVVVGQKIIDKICQIPRHLSSLTRVDPDMSISHPLESGCELGKICYQSVRIITVPFLGGFVLAFELAAEFASSSEQSV